MKPNKILSLERKLNGISNYLAVLQLKIKGLRIGKGVLLEKITCDWPNKLIIGNSCVIQNAVNFRIWHPYNTDSFINIGDRVFIGHACEFVCNSGITIGNDCLIASNTVFNDTGHEYSKHSKINIQPVSTKKISIEEDVWIGTSSVILQGVTIGKGAIIGAGSVVNKSIPEYEIWAGVPVRFIKKRE
jgi:acetyltransferase-like isoleucine patch superfamily enzyme